MIRDTILYTTGSGGGKALFSNNCALVSGENNTKNSAHADRRMISEQFCLHRNFLSTMSPPPPQQQEWKQTGAIFITPLNENDSIFQTVSPQPNCLE